MKFSLALALALTFGIAVGAAASAQDAPPMPPAPTDRAAVRQRWKEMSPEERKRVQESYERWKTLSGEKKEQLRKRHDRLDEERRAADRFLADDDRTRIEKLRGDVRRKELTDRALKLVKERFDHLPPDLKQRIERELHDAPPSERPARLRALLQQEIAPQIRGALHRRVERGELPREEVETLAKQVHDAPTPERARLLREFILAHPEAFRLPPKLREQMKRNGDALDDLRLIEQLRDGKGKGSGKGGAKVPQSPPRKGRPPKDRDEAASPADGHRRI